MLPGSSASPTEELRVSWKLASPTEEQRASVAGSYSSVKAVGFYTLAFEQAIVGLKLAALERARPITSADS